MLDVLTLWLKHHRERAELDRLGIEELGRVARDLAISPRELYRLVDVAHDPQRLSEMLKALGIDEAILRDARPALLRSLQRVCALCDELRQCRRALDRHNAAATYQQFCPNAMTLRELRAEAAQY
jgi:uncharacterized protein DUF6455